MSLASLNVWIGAPLVGLWVGSRLVGDEQISMLGVFGATVTMLFVALVLLRLLAALDARFAHLSGRTSTVRRHQPWLRSARGERQFDRERGDVLTPLEYVLVASVIACVIAFEVWFLFYSGSPLDGRTGRG